MTFKEAVEGTPDVADAWRPGLKALAAADKAHVAAEDTHRLRGGVYVDGALERKKEHKNARRWDYAVGHKPANRKVEMIYWIETHPASEHGIGEVLNKLQWLRQWLGESARLLHKMPAAFIWVSSGKTSFTARSPQARRLAQAGVRNVGRSFVIPDNAPD